MARTITVELIDRVKGDVRDLLRDAARRLPHLGYADCRLEVIEGKFATAENGESKSSGDDYGFAAGVRVLAGDRMIAPGWVGLALGTADVDELPARLREALERAYRRALVNAEMKAAAREKLGPLGEALADTRLHPVEVREDTVPAVYAVDPRALPLGEMVAFTTDVSRRVAAADAAITHNYISTLTQLSRELFASSEGALIDQSFALTQGMCYVIGVEGPVSQELYDVLGHQRGWEILAGGVEDPLLVFPPFIDFSLAMARESVELARAPALPTSAGDEVVVTDPHYNTLLSHEIVGHPVELDRALKMETAYAGRSWLMAGLDDHQVGRRIASPLVSAYSDPSLPGYGHYVYDHEGTPARRVTHIERGVFRGFMNSRQTAAVFGGAPNGHFKATDASLVPLIRMSSTVFAVGERDARDIVREIDHGWYLMGHRIPSIAESRENFRISARKVYEIRHGELGRLYRDGGIMADSRDFLMNVDAVGSDFRLYPIPNCGKGQPMQTKKLGNGGPTMRSRARLAGG
ncbi:MAG TPA: TldD/PmbA family protein [Candidatus Binatia bacterium]|nr:TldD/PmbA family protein [Candidatus Binatia bacterium]